MRPLMCSALALMVSTAAHADDILLRADISAATVFGQGAEITRQVSVAIPEGAHRIIIPMRDIYDAALIQVTGPDGVQIGAPQRLDGFAIEEGVLDSGAERAARDAVDSAEDALQGARDALAREDAAIRGLDAQLAYLTALARGGEDGVAIPGDPATLTQILTTLGGETARIGGELQAAREGRRALQDAVADRQEDLQRALDALEDLQAFGTETPAIAIDTVSDAATEGTLTITYLTGAAEWRPSYSIGLDTEAAELSIERQIAFSYFGEAVWRDVDMVFSTANPTRQRAPSQVGPSPVRLFDPEAPRPEVSVRGAMAGLTDALADQPVVEPVVVAEAAAFAQPLIEGLSLVYQYRDPVTLGVEGDILLPLDTVSLDAALENRAVPRRDATAFLMAEMANDIGAPLLPGDAVLYRDSDLIGETYMPLVADGADFEMAFGALDHLRLSWLDLSRDQGDRGVFVTSNEENRVIRFGVENLSDEAETVRLIYATPFSEQEDLEVSIDLSRAPDDVNVDDMRGVVGWNIDLAPGQEEQIEMEVYLSWPEDQVIDWRP